MDMADVIELLLAEAGKNSDVGEAEAYASRNRMTMARIETLRKGARMVGPNPQQLKTLESCGASVRVEVGKAVGMAGTSYLTPESLKGAVELAVQNARRMEADPNFISLAKPLGRSVARLPHDKAVLDGAVEEPLLEGVETAVSLLDRKDMDIAGKLMAVSSEFWIGNTNGVSVDGNVDTFTVAQLTAEWLDGSEIVSSGVGWDSSRTLSRLKVEKAAKDALGYANVKPELTKVPEGEYSVVLEPYAVSDIVDNMLATAFALDAIYLGFSWVPTERGKVESGQDALLPKVGERVAHDSLTFSDQPHIEDGMASTSYDDEGLPTEAKTIIENGIWRGNIGDSYYSYLYGLEPSGHGFRTSPSPGRCSGCGPAANGTNFVIEPGDMSMDELVESCDGPTLILPRTWYTYPTRYGAPTFSSSNRSTSYLVDKGVKRALAPNAFKLIGDVKVLLNEVTGIGKETKTATTWGASASSIVPAIATKGFRVEKSAF